MTEHPGQKLFLQQDSLQVAGQTATDTAVVHQKTDTTPQTPVAVEVITPDSTHEDTPEVTVVREVVAQPVVEPETVQPPVAKKSGILRVDLPRRDTQSHRKADKQFDRFSFYSGEDSSAFAVNSGDFIEYNSMPVAPHTSEHIPIAHHYHRAYLNWSLLVGLMCVTFLLLLKVYYSKFTRQVVSTVVNFQLAEKMLREKNIVGRRAFLIMNLNYVLVISLFIHLLGVHWGIKLTNGYFLDYLVTLGVVAGVLILRLILFYIAGFLFDKLPQVNQHIHINYLVNKNLGLILLPLAFASIYTAARISEILLYTGIIIILAATLYRFIRVFQIIIRDVFLFYAILYLCTLELLPIVLGSKIIISLR